MNKYIVITKGGYTQDDSGYEVENCQVIGTFYASSPDDAIHLAMEQIFDSEHDFSVDDLMVYQLHQNEK